MATLSRKRDNEVNRLNKRLQRVAESVGTTSALYNELASQVIRLIGKPLTDNSRGYLQIKRTAALDNISPQRMNALVAYFENHNLGNYKKFLRQHIKQSREYANKQDRMITAETFKKTAARLNQISQDVDDARDYLYQWQNEPEYNQAMRYLNITGRRNSYEELAEVIRLANQLAIRINDTSELKQPYQKRLEASGYLRFGVDPDDYNSHIRR